jgi:hypothetical protein
MTVAGIVAGTVKGVAWKVAQTAHYSGHELKTVNYPSSWSFAVTWRNCVTTIAAS